MNLTRCNPALETLRDGSQEGDVLYFRSKWQNAGEKHLREQRHHSAILAHPNNPNLYLTPYAHEYFQGEIPIEMPKNSKVKKIVVATDLDTKFWHWDYSGPPSGAFDDFLDEVYQNIGLKAGNDLWSFFERSFVRNMRHTPKAMFFNKEYSTALVVLSAYQSASFHLSEMAGVACLPDTDFDKGEVHDALLRHEWFHLSDDRHMSEAQKEIGADKEAINGIKTQSLKQAWIDARIVGGFMWPFPERQKGLALVDDKFNKAMFQDLQMGVVLDWCQQVFREFYDPIAASDLISNINEGIINDGSTLPQDMQDFLQNKLYDITRYQRQEIQTADEFEAWVKKGKDPKLAEKVWGYYTQAYMMRLQISNSRSLDFYGSLFALSKRISNKHDNYQSTYVKVHDMFRESLKRLLPDVDERKGKSSVTFLNTQLPDINVNMSPYVG